MDPAACRTDAEISTHQVDEKEYRFRFEVDVAVKCQDVGIIGHLFFDTSSDWLIPETVSQQVIHVHHLYDVTTRTAASYLYQVTLLKGSFLS